MAASRRLTAYSVANVTKPGAQKKGRSHLTQIRKASERDKQDMKNTKSITKIMATFAILFSFATIVATAATAIINPLAAYGDWPKTVMYQPRDAEGQTGLTIAQCDSPEQCKEVNGTPSPNLAAKKQCEEFSGEKCKKVK